MLQEIVITINLFAKFEIIKIRKIKKNELEITHRKQAAVASYFLTGCTEYDAFFHKFYAGYYVLGDRGGTVVKVLQIGRSQVRSQVTSLEFFVDIKSFRSHYGSEVDSASNRNEYQEYFLG